MRPTALLGAAEIGQAIGMTGARGPAAVPLEPQVVAYIRRWSGRYTREQLTARLLKDGVHPRLIQRAYESAFTPVLPARPQLITAAPSVRSARTAPPSPREKESSGGLIVKLAAFGGLSLIFAIVAGVDVLKDSMDASDLRTLAARMQSPAANADLRDAPAPAAQPAATVRVGGKNIPVTREQVRKLEEFQTRASMAQDAFARKRYEDALRLAGEALGGYDAELFGAAGRQGLLELRGQALALSGHAEEAERIAAELGPAGAQLRYLLAKAAFDRGDFAGAAEHAGRMMTAHSDQPAGYALQAAAYARMGQYKGAIRRFTDALERVGNDPRFANDGANQANLFFNRGVLRANLGLRNDALGDLSRALKFDPLRPEYYEARAQLQAALGKPELARRDAERAKALRAEAAKSPAAARGVQDLGLPVLLPK